MYFTFSGIAFYYELHADRFGCIRGGGKNREQRREGN